MPNEYSVVFCNLNMAAQWSPGLVLGNTKASYNTKMHFVTLLGRSRLISMDRVYPIHCGQFCLRISVTQRARKLDSIGSHICNFFTEMVPCARLDRAKARGTLNSTTDRWACRHGTKHLEVDMASTLALGSLHQQARIQPPNARAALGVRAHGLYTVANFG